MNWDHTGVTGMGQLHNANNRLRLQLPGVIENAIAITITVFN